MDAHHAKDAFILQVGEKVYCLAQAGDYWAVRSILNLPTAFGFPRSLVILRKRTQSLVGERLTALLGKTLWLGRNETYASFLGALQ